MTRYLVPLAGFLIISAFLALGLRLDPREVPSPLIDKPAPSFELPRLIAQGEVLAPRQLVGRVWLLNVWASWCVSCRAEHVLLNEIARDRQVEIVGLNYKDTRADARAWLDHLGNPYTAIAVDTEGKVGIDWGVYGVPEPFVIDAQGLIRYKHIGPLERAVLEQKILPLVRQLKRTAA